MFLFLTRRSDGISLYLKTIYFLYFNYLTYLHVYKYFVSLEDLEIFIVLELFKTCADLELKSTNMRVLQYSVQNNKNLFYLSGLYKKGF
jgi:hypothetical protein